MNKYLNAVNGSPEDLDIPLKVIRKRDFSDYMTISFERPKGFTYKPGDWIDIRFLSAKLSVGNTYSFASSPTEPDLMIGFKKGVSKFKKALENLDVGETMLITQFGNNDFVFKPKFDSVFIAGGIGITPFRSIIKEAIDEDIKTNMTLLYLNSSEDFLFKEGFNKWKKTYPNLQIHYWVTGKQGRLTKETIKQLIPDIQDKFSYVIGPPSMVTNTKNMLLTIGITEQKVKTDSFDGYD